jgi:hypothetical protein
MTSSRWRTAFVAALGLAIINLGFTDTAQAGIVDTSVLLQSARSADLTVIHAQLARADVRAQLAGFGVEAAAIEQRLNNLSDRELATLASHMTDAPAGAGVLGVVLVLVAVYIGLMILLANFSGGK